MEKTLFKITSNKPLTKHVYEMCLSGDTSAIKHAGQFINIAIDGLYLRRPISICDYSENFLKGFSLFTGNGISCYFKSKKHIIHKQK